jgi:hypothetical protein
MCTWSFRTYELTKFTKESEKKITQGLLILLYLCIKFEVQIPSNEGEVEKTISDRSKLRNLSEISFLL